MGEELKVIITAEVAKFKKGIDEAKNQMNGFGKDTDSTSKKVKINFKEIGESIKNATVTVSKSIVGAVTAMSGLVVATEGYAVNQNKLNTAFTTAGASAETAKKTYNELYRVLGDGDVATEAANHLAKITTNQKSLSEWTNICKGVYATFGDSLPIEGLTEASNETAKTGQVTGALADALNWSAKAGETYGVKLKANTKANKEWNNAVKACTTAEDYFNLALQQCNSEAEREKLIRKTLTSAYDEASSKYEKNASDIIAQNEAQAKLQESLAKVGEALRPIVTLFTNFGSEALEIVIPYLKDLADTIFPNLQDVLDDVGGKIDVVKEKILGLKVGFESATDWAKQHETALTLVGIAVGTLTTALIAYNVAQTIAKAGGIANIASLAINAVGYYALATAEAVATTATSVFGAVMAFVTSPITLVIVAIGALIAIIVLCVKNWDKIKATVSNVAKIVKEKVVTMVNAVKEKFNAMKSAIGTVIDNIKSTVSSKFNAVKNTITTIITAIKSVVSTIFGEIKSTISTIINNIKNTISKVMDSAKNTVKNVIDKIKGFFKFKWSLPKLKMPKISISGKFSINPPSVPKFSISWHKLGGVFDNPTLFNYGNSLHGLGEDGAEAIVPLEKNTQWLDKIAEKLSEKQGNTPIILQVDGKTFAQISVDSINSLTKQTGKLPIKLA